jgi:hypothetical protein
MKGAGLSRPFSFGVSKMPDTYAIAGFSDTSDPVILFEADSATSCDEWRTGYIRFGDWGGYDALALFEIAPYQSVDTIHLFDAPIDVLEKGAV